MKGDSTNREYPWQRFWVPQGGEIDLSDGGFLLDPLREAEWPGGTELHSLPELSGYRALALLGEPGMGKSVALEIEARRLAEQEPTGELMSIHANLRAYSSEGLLYSKIFESPEFLAWKEANSRLVLHLDSLDEALLRIDTIASLLADELPKLPVERLWLRIACRTAVWPGMILTPVLETLWGNEAVSVVEIAPLRRSDVQAAASLWPIDVDAFLEQVRTANAVPFAIKPLTLDLLLRLFERNAHLPHSIAEPYRQGCLNLCEEQSPARRAARRSGRLTPPQRLRLAGRLAAVSMFANRYAIWTGIESSGVPEEDVALSGLAVGSEQGEFQRFDVTTDTLREVLDTGLFSSRGENRMGWAHQSYAEYLAADYLGSKKVPANNILNMLRHPSGGLVPQLSMVSAWAASLDPDVRRELIAQEPVVLLHGDLTGWASDDLAALTDALLLGLDQNRVHDFMLGLSDRYKRLAHAGLADQIQPYIVETTKSVPARRAAMRIAEACSLKKLQGDLLTVALDQGADPHMRSCAVSALGTCGDEETKLELLPLALGGQGPDPDDEIKGYALGILWPEHLSANNLFQHISPPNESFLGAYASFLTRILPNSLTRPSLTAALEWATAFVTRVDHMGEFHRKRLADAILIFAWDHIEDPEITPLVAQYVFTVIRTHHQLFVGTDRDEHGAFGKRLESDVAGRRCFVKAVAAAPVGRPSAFYLLRYGLLAQADLPWLLSIGPSSGSTFADVDEAALCDLVQAALNLNNEQHFEALCEIAPRWPLLRSRYTSILDGVLLDSPLARQEKEQHRYTSEFAEHRRPRVDPPPAQRVRECLDRFDKGDVRAWWQMNRELTLTPQSTHYASYLEYRITDTPGWSDADETTRDRILASAVPFLERAESSVDQWLGTNSVDFSDLAAYRALVLLRELRRDVYDHLDTALWRKWAPVVAIVPQQAGTEAAGLHDAITADATTAAPDEIATTVLTVIRSEKQKELGREQSQPVSLSPFRILGQLSPSQDNESLRSGLLTELQDESNSPEQLAALLEFLLRAKVGLAREYALQLFAAWPCAPVRRPHALAVAATLLEFDGAAAWPPIWSVISIDGEFGSEVFLRAAHRHRVGVGFYVGLGESQLADLYVWLEQRFSRSEDPHQADDGVHWMGPRDSVVHLRDEVLSVLINRGTPEAVAALRTVTARLPEQTWLAYRLIEADQIMRQRTWLPLTPAEVIRVVGSLEGHLIQSAPQLADILVAALRKYEDELHGEQTPIRDLWDRQADESLRPVEEDALSDHVKRFLKRDLVDRGIILNREVEIGRVPGAPIGSRTDIRVDAVRKAENGDSFDAITAVIETKGCWNAGLMTAIKTQLYDDYLTRLGAPIGIYLVGWFDKSKWDPQDRRRGRSPLWDAAETQQRLDAKAAELPAGFVIKVIVIDCHAP